MTVMLAFPFKSQAQNSALLLFDAETGRNFAGCLNCERDDDAAVCNQSGPYGSQFAKSSIWNAYGQFGSKYQKNSPWNPYGSGLRVVDRDGNFYGSFSVNQHGSYQQSELPIVQSVLKAYEILGDTQQLLFLLCEDPDLS